MNAYDIYARRGEDPLAMFDEAWFKADPDNDEDKSGIGVAHELAHLIAEAVNRLDQTERPLRKVPARTKAKMKRATKKKRR